MTTALPLNWSRIVLRGVLAGIAGGVLFNLFLYAALLHPQHQSMLNWWQFVASTAVGKAAYGSASYAWIGLAMHAATSIAWGIGYSYLSETQPGVNARPLLSGLVFGLVVFVVMEIALAAVGLLVVTGSTIGQTIVAHVVFFGLPVAFINDWQRPRIA